MPKFHKLSMNELQRPSAEEVRQKTDKYPISLVLDNIRSMHNVGSIFRTADALNVKKILLCGITARPPHREITKTALGATESVAWQYFENTVDAVFFLKKQHYTVIAIEQTQESIALHDFLFESKPYAFVFGNEVHGVQPEVLNLCDSAIEIPQFGMKHSFNVSITSAIVLWEYVRHFLKSQPSNAT